MLAIRKASVVIVVVGDWLGCALAPVDVDGCGGGDEIGCGSGDVVGCDGEWLVCRGLSGVWVSCRRASWEGRRASWEGRGRGSECSVVVWVSCRRESWEGRGVIWDGRGGSVTLVVPLGGWWLFFCDWCCDGTDHRFSVSGVVFDSSDRIISRCIYRCVLHNSCLPRLVAIDLIEHVGKDFVLGGWRRNKFEFVRLLVEEGKLSVGFGDWACEQGGG